MSKAAVEHCVQGLCEFGFPFVLGVYLGLRIVGTGWACAALCKKGSPFHSSASVPAFGALGVLFVCVSRLIGVQWLLLWL